jgi:hypothetical protein
MNRDLRRSLQRKSHDQKFITYDANRIIEHNKVKKAMDEGIVMGFYCAIQMLGSLCDEVSGIGHKRKEQLIGKYKDKMVHLKQKLESGEYE